MKIFLNHYAPNFLLGHVRYPTSAAGARDGLAPLQPLTGTHPVLGPLALAHNGNIPSLDGVGGSDAPPSLPVTDTMRVRGRVPPPR